MERRDEAKLAADWPLEPIVIFEGVPIRVFAGYSGTGIPEGPIGYVEYCLSECRPASTRYRVHSREELRAVVERYMDEFKVPEGCRDRFLAQVD